MAKKAAAAKRATGSNGSAPTKEVTLKVEMSPPEDVPSYYSNHVQIARTKHEFSLSFGHLPARFSNEKLTEMTKSGVLQIKPDVEIILPPTVIPGLISALTAQKDMFEKEHGPIKDESGWAKPEGKK